MHAQPAAVLLAEQSDEISTLLHWCYQRRVPVTCRGRGTGTTGGSVPLLGGVVLSLERMQRIIDFDPANRTMTVEPGVINSAVQSLAATAGLFWPPDPTSRDACTIGGNLACNAAGARAVKYGTPRENTLGLRAVDGRGRSLRCGCYTTKGVVGYDLTRLLIGSEGTLAVITEATLKLHPLAAARRTLRLSYDTIHSAATAVTRIMGQPIIPYTLEMMDKRAIAMVRDRYPLGLPANTGALLLVEVEGSVESLDAAVAAVITAGSVSGLLEQLEPHTQAEIDRLWQTRKVLSPTLRQIAPKKINEDVVVPITAIPDLIEGLAQIEATYHLPIVNFGHAGNGNIHVNLLIDSDDVAQMQRAEVALSEIFTLVLSLKGTLSGEHGVGRSKRDYISRELDPVSLDLMWAIKNQFDPAHILNPEKSLPYQTPLN
ncbi:MAG: FAD-binding protein [Gammaproteobacteria bacterium]|nr:FAD-binding protein [Gammaproteobacteria bacterium]